MCVCIWGHVCGELVNMTLSLRAEPLLSVPMNATSLALLEVALNSPQYWMLPWDPTLTWWPPFGFMTLNQVPGGATRKLIRKGFAVLVAQSCWIPPFPGRSHVSESLTIFLWYRVSFYISQDDKFKLLACGFVEGAPGPRPSTEGFQNSMK